MAKKYAFEGTHVQVARLPITDFRGKRVIGLILMDTEEVEGDIVLDTRVAKAAGNLAYLDTLKDAAGVIEQAFNKALDAFHANIFTGR